MMASTSGTINAVFKVKREGGGSLSLGGIRELEALLNSNLTEELHFLNKELKLNSMYNFKKEGTIKNETLLTLKEFLNG